MPGVEEENRVGTGAAPFSPFLPAAGIAAGTEEDADAEQERKPPGRRRRLDSTLISDPQRQGGGSLCMAPFHDAPGEGEGDDRATG